MELGLGNTLLPGDPRLIDHIVAEVKSQGIFDQFRKECIADVDTKPAYQNLHARVESSVNNFLSKQTWRADLNKNQLRETLRKHIHNAPYLDAGVDRIVDQVVNPKIYSIFMPKIEDVVYKYLGIERPKSQRNGACDLKDLLPTDLDPVSESESEKDSIKDESMEIVVEDEKKVVNGDDQKPSVSNAESKPVEVSVSPVKKEEPEAENEKEPQAMDTELIKSVLNASFKSDEGVKTEEEEEESPDFEPIEALHQNESNMSNDSHLSGISELTSHRSASPDFATEFARDNFDCSNQDSQLSKVSSNSRLSIVTDIGSSNHGSTPKSDAKEDTKSAKVAKDSDSNKDSKFNFDVAKIKENSKMSSSSKESSRDATDYKDSKSKDESKSKSSKDKHDSRSSRGKDRDSSRRHSSKRKHRSRSKDKTDTDSQEGKDFCQKSKEIKIKETEKKDDPSDDVSDLKDRYKEKIRELREKIELTEKGKLGKLNLDMPKDKKDSPSLKDKEEHKRSSHKSSSSRSSSHHSKSSRSSETKESRDKSSSRHEERRHTNGKGESKSSSKSRRDSKSDSRSGDRSRDKKRRDEKKSKPIDDHSSLRKNLNERRSSDRDGSDGSNSKYSHKSSFSTNTSSSKFGPTSELAKDSKEQHSSGETDSVHDSIYKANDGLPKKVDPGSSEICLPLKKRRLLSEDSQDEGPAKKKRSSEKKALKKKLDHLDAFKSDSDVASVPDDERVQIVEYADEEDDQPYPDKEEVTLSLEETKKIILDGEPSKPTLSEMELSIQASLSEMMAEHKTSEAVKETKVEDSKPNLSEMELSIQASLSDMMAENKVSEIVNEPAKESPVEDPKPNLSEMDCSISQSLGEMMAEPKVSEIVNEPFKESPAEDPKPSLSEMDCSIRQSLSEMMADHRMSESDDAEPVKVSTVMDSSSLLEALTDDSSTDREAIGATSTEDAVLENKVTDVKVEEAKKESVEKLDTSQDCETNVEKVEENKEIPECSKEEKTDEKDESDVEKQLEQFEVFDDKPKEDIIKKAEEEVPEIQESTEKVGPEIEQPTEIKEEQYVEKTEQNLDEIKKVEAEPDQKATDEIEQDKDNEADSDDANEEDTLVIDEEADEKENDCVEKPDVAEKVKDCVEKFEIAEKIEESSEKKSSNESQTNKAEVSEVLPEGSAAEVKNKVEDELKDEPAEQITKEDVGKPKEPEVTENPITETIEPKDAKQEIKNELVVQLAKFMEDKHASKDKFKESIADEVPSKDDASIQIMNLDDCSDKSMDTTKMDSDDDSDILEIKSTDEKLDNIPEFDPLAEDSMDVEKSEDLNEVDPLAQDPLDVEKSDETSQDPLAIDEKITGSPIEELDCSPEIRSDSPVEEDCRYFDNDDLSKNKYLSFKKYLDKLEAAEVAATKVTEEKVVTPEVPAPIVKQVPAVSAPTLKRKHSPSPIPDNIIPDNNNDGLTTTKQPVVVEVQATIEEQPVVVAKKRKTAGRMKKSSSSGSVASSTSEQQPQEKEPPQQQQQQAPIVNGDSFMMPPSPESDISVSSDKNLGGIVKEERRAQRSSQRYSSDDLYKPRPAFASSSRRTRRNHQA